MDDEGQGRKFQKDLNSGLVALVLLAVLDRSPEDLYGYEIAKRLQKANEGEALFKEGTIYPVLRTLERRRPAHQPHRAFLLRPAAALLPDHRRGPRAPFAVERHLAADARLRRPLH